MKILLLFSNTMFGLSGSVRYIVPLGLCFIASYLKKNGHDVKILHLTSHMTSDIEKIRTDFKREFEIFNPDIIGFSFRDIYTSQKPRNPEDTYNLISYFYVYYDKKIIDAIRSLTDVPIVGGGSAFSQEPLLHMEYLKLDFGIIGEGESAFNNLIDALHDKKDYSPIKGLVYKKEGNYIINKNEFIKDLSTIPPITNGLLRNFNGMYYDNGGYMSIQTKRGCSFNCIYCNYPNLEGNEYRYRPIPYVIEELKYHIEKYNVRYFYFVDSIFSFPTDFAKKVCRAIIDNKLDIGWEACISPKSVDEELTSLMKESGCIGVSITPDTCSKKVLNSYQKGFQKEEIKNVVDLMHEHDIPFDFYIILGGPGDDLTSFSETMDFCKMYLKNDVLVIVNGIFLHRGCTSFELAIEENKIGKDMFLKDAVFNNDFAAFKKFRYFYTNKKDKISVLKELENTRNPKWIRESDYVYDEKTNCPKIIKDFNCIPNQRPWFLKMKGLSDS